VDKQKSRVHVSAVDSDGTPATIFPGILVNGTQLEAEPFVHTFPSGTQLVDIELYFYGHYNEPPVQLQVPCKNGGRNYFDLSYNPMTGKWIVDHKGETAQFTGNYNPPPFPEISELATKPQPVGFSVEPREDCPHFQSGVAIGVSSIIGQAFKKNSCGTCNDSSENWVCLACGKTCCSRYVNGHASEHAASTNHKIVLSFSDLSVWCYACSDYIKDPFLTTMFVGELYKAKFGENVH